MKEHIQFGGEAEKLTKGSGGRSTQAPGQASTVSGLARLTGGIGAGKMVETSIG